jgi:hypothetical protein
MKSINPLLRYVALNFYLYIKQKSEYFIGMNREWIRVLKFNILEKYNN